MDQINWKNKSLTTWSMVVANLYQFYDENKLRIPIRWINETYKNTKVDKKQMIIDYISGMTDRYVLNIYNKI